MNKFTGAKFFTIHANDAGTDAYDNGYVEWMEAELASVRADRDERAVQKGELLAEIERLREELRNDEEEADEVITQLKSALGTLACYDLVQEQGGLNDCDRAIRVMDKQRAEIERLRVETERLTSLLRSVIIGDWSITGLQEAIGDL